MSRRRDADNRRVQRVELTAAGEAEFERLRHSRRRLRRAAARRADRRRRDRARRAARPPAGQRGRPTRPGPDRPGCGRPGHGGRGRGGRVAAAGPCGRQSPTPSRRRERRVDSPRASGSAGGRTRWRSPRTSSPRSAGSASRSSWRSAVSRLRRRTIACWRRPSTGPWQTAPWLSIPAGLAAVATGVLLGLGTSFGLVRHWWVVVKIVIAAAVIVTDAVLVGHVAHDAVAGRVGPPLYGSTIAHVVVLGDRHGALGVQASRPHAVGTAADGGGRDVEGPAARPARARGLSRVPVAGPWCPDDAVVHCRPWPPSSRSPRSRSSTIQRTRATSCASTARSPGSSSTGPMARDARSSTPRSTRPSRGRASAPTSRPARSTTRASGGSRSCRSARS